MWISMKVNPPNDKEIVLVRMDDGSDEMECYAVAKYNQDELEEFRFTPVNCSSPYHRHVNPVLDFPVISWRKI